MTKFQLAAFTHAGFYRANNQDRVLAGKAVISSGMIHTQSENGFQAFVTDGVGGSRMGDFSAQFVLEEILQYPFSQFSPEQFQSYSLEIQAKLRLKFENYPAFQGSATTLVGAVYEGNQGYIINAGDADARLWNGKSWQVLNEKQIHPEIVHNPPVISYFGGNCNQLNLSITPFSFEPGNVLLLSSDGLWLATDEKRITHALQASTLETVTESEYQFTQNEDARDNVSAIFIRMH